MEPHERAHTDAEHLVNFNRWLLCATAVMVAIIN
jgi:hypothetical protein